jgi:hypothetical protein
MRVFFLHPKLTIPDSERAVRFYDACKSELEEHLEVTAVSTPAVLGAARAGRGDSVIFFNRADQDYDPALIRFLESAVRASADLLPVAVAASMRLPPPPASGYQSFDLTEQIRHRNLPEANVGTVAVAFARTLICRLQPTLSMERMRLFISHRRLDGEEIAAAFCKQLRTQAESVFRDLIDVRVGQNAQEEIEASLLQSDAVIFLDTPKAGTSDWVAREIEMALGLRLPIVWVRIGPEDGRSKLQIEPARVPHIELPDLDPAAVELDTEHVNRALDAAFRISREASRRVFDQIQRIKIIDGHDGAQVADVDTRRLIFEVRIPRKGFRYPQRPLIHLVQFYGRWPKDEDESDLVKRVGELGYVHTWKHGPAYDAVLLLGPIPSQAFTEVGDRQCYVDSSEEYVSTLEKYLAEPESVERVRKGLIIAGAFPDAEPDHQQHLTDAVSAFVRATLDRGGTVVFGGHPTFTPLVLDTAKRRRPKDFKGAVHLYQSMYFMKDGELEKLKSQATTFATETVSVADPATDPQAAAKNKAASLTLMRRSMIDDAQAAGLVVIGGRTASGGHSPGVDEEIRFARERGLPVFFVGSAGGRAAELCAGMKADGWRDKPNSLSVEDNEELLSSLDHGVLANKVLDALGL